MKVRPFFRWYDLWVGAYIDTKARKLYVCPLPMVGVCIEWRVLKEVFSHEEETDARD